jgi:transcriptional regulator with XRE-family HTH domain
MRQRMAEDGCSHAQLALRIPWDRSSVTRALSGARVPTLKLAVAIATALKMDIDAVERAWMGADAARRRAQMFVAEGGPPGDLRDYADLRRALRDLLARCGMSQRELVVRDQTGMLTRSTVGAVLRGDRSAGSWVLDAIVRGCGVSETAAAAWRQAWARFGEPFRVGRLESRLDGFKRKRFADAMAEWERRRENRGQR